MGLFKFLMLFEARDKIESRSVFVVGTKLVISDLRELQVCAGNRDSAFDLSRFS